MRRTAIILVMLLSLPLEAATWYVRPASGEYGAEDGTSFETAFDGFSGINWSAIGPGDTLYVCDTWQFVDFGGDFAYGANAIGASGEPGNPITIRGDLADHPGVIIAARKYAAASFTDLEDGSYSYKTDQSHPGGVWQGDPTGTPELLKYVASAELVASTDGSWWFNGPTKGLYVNPYDSAGMEDIYTVGLGALLVNGQDHLVIDGLKLFGGAGNDGVVRLCKTAGNDAEHITIRNCEIAFGSYTGVYAAGSNASYILIEDCVIHDVATGTYSLYAGGVQFSDWTFRRVEVYSGQDVRNCFYDATAADRHALGGQAIRNWLVEYCYIHDWAGDGILNYVGTSNYADNVTIRYNRIDNLNDNDGANHHFGIARHGTNSANWSARTANWNIYGNVISNLGTGAAGDVSGDGAAIRLKGPGGTSDQWPKIYNNTIHDCRVGLFWVGFGQEGGGGFDFRNNIVLSPKTGGWHVYIAPATGTTAVVMDNNCWYPDTSGSDNRFMWYGSTASDHHTTASTNFVAKALADSVTIDANSLVADPVLVNAAAGSLWLQSGSPCRGGGVAVSVPIGRSHQTPRATLKLVFQSFPSPPDIGAHGYHVTQYFLGSVQ